MLTNMFYYGYYKPYILRTTGVEDRGKAKLPKIAEKRDSAESFKVLLNKSFKPEVVDYARGVTGSVVGARESSKNLVRDMTEFNKNLQRRGLDTAKKWIKYDLEEFTQAYNNTTEFLSRQKHSQSLRGFAERVTDNITDGLDRLRTFGLDIDDAGKLAFNGEEFDNLDESTLNMAIGETLNLFDDIYIDSGGVLSDPLKDHMNFKGLGYYYNYKLGKMESDTFKIIESGLIIDKVV